MDKVLRERFDILAQLTKSPVENKKLKHFELDENTVKNVVGVIL